jgi:hypothetical protein
MKFEAIVHEADETASILDQAISSPIVLAAGFN